MRTPKTKLTQQELHAANLGARMAQRGFVEVDTPYTTALLRDLHSAWLTGFNLHFSMERRYIKMTSYSQHLIHVVA